ncbi:Catechol 2,3-dioxygenase [Brevibacterium siliguriense]|uniref:Catechol 2,3-dioxygenase n=1 Tax=Brevibacterium siliguriense TaxID=1136497 RepID=A0A1H1LTK7_9MICO|nr:VOC family protein [Brevibacterium siliguriense]SDR77871.1 Catechol 2,3-dioxygenase [Brevibacterium siliguriense]
MTGEAKGTGFPELLHTVIDSTDLRMLAEFYRQLLGYVYRPGDEPTDGRGSGASAEAEVPDWLVLTDAIGNRKLAFQLVDRLEPTTWPSTDIPMQMHLDLTVPNRSELDRQRNRAESLGAAVLFDRADDEDEPLYVFADPSGHPFCIFVA